MARTIRLWAALALVAGLGAIASPSALAASASVTNCSGNASTKGSLPYVVAHASSGEKVTFARNCSGSSAILLPPQSPMSVTLGLTIDGKGHSVQISGGSSAQADQTDLFEVGSGGRLTLQHLTLENAGSTAESFAAVGLSGTGGLKAKDCTFTGNIEAIHDAGPGKVSVAQSTFTDNSSSPGGVITSGTDMTVGNETLAVSSSTFSNNTGSAIYSQGTATITNSTITSTSSPGGAITDRTGSNSRQIGRLAVKNSTIAGNTTGLSVTGLGAAAKLTATIIAENTVANCAGTTTEIGDGGYNLEDTAISSCGFSAAQHDIVGQNPQLRSLAKNGGPTETIALKANSPAIDYVPTSTGLCPKVDQRGAKRPDSKEHACDIGAYETGSKPK